MVVSLNRRRGGEEGIYHCKIPDLTNVTQTIYIGIYTAQSGESMLCSFQPFHQGVASSYLKALVADLVSFC